MSKGKKKQGAKTPPVPTVPAKATTPEGKAIEKKLADLQNKYRVKMKAKQDKINELNALDEEITKMVGAFNALKELQADVAKPVEDVKEDVKPEAPVEGDKAEDAPKEEDVKEEVVE